MSFIQEWITIAMVVLGTVFTRFMPFLIFPEDRPTPSYIKYLGKVLPYGVMGMLVVYCLKDTEIFRYPYGAAEILGILTVSVLHIWKRNLFLSISAGTLVYMVLVQKIF